MLLRVETLLSCPHIIRSALPDLILNQITAATVQFGVNLERTPSYDHPWWRRVLGGGGRSWAGQTLVLIWAWSCGGTGWWPCRWRCTETRSEPSSFSESGAWPGILGHPAPETRQDKSDGGVSSKHTLSMTLLHEITHRPRQTVVPLSKKVVPT